VLSHMAHGNIAMSKTQKPTGTDTPKAAAKGVRKPRTHKAPKAPNAKKV
jgi:hypothetical protein